MKKLTLLLGAVLALMLVCAGIFWFGGALHAEPRVLTAGAAEYPDVFQSIRSVLKSGAAPQTFDGAALGEADCYTMMDITLTLRNRGFLPAEWLHMELAGEPGDVAVYSLSGEGTSLPARSEGQVNLKLITAADPGPGRTVTVEYYVFGVKRRITVAPPTPGEEE